MGHYLSETPGYERPEYNFAELHELNYDGTGVDDHLWYHFPCLRMFYVESNTDPVPKPLKKHAKRCK